ncbi:MAG: ATP-binding protein [Candidatus Omnitrophica bacterium]|nr:ATP-binding protein [Candidatus Omnitrophota bacterium]
MNYLSLREGMDSMLQWFQLNLDIVFFVYGLAFLIMGITVLIQLRGESRFKIVDIIWALAGFGITHGVNELLDMWVIIKGRHPAVDILRWFILVISYIFLFEFGRRFFYLNSRQKKHNRVLNSIWVWPALVIIISVLSFGSSDIWKIGGIWARYLLGFPGAILAGLGFLSYYKKELQAPLKLKKYFQAAGVVFLVYGFLSGLVVPKADFFPANWLNNDSFLSLMHIPVQVLRCLCAIISAWAVIGALNIFNWETSEGLQNFLEQREKITEGIEEGIMLVDKEFNILWANKALMRRHGEILGDKCYRVVHRRESPCEAPLDACPVAEALKEKKVVSLIHTHLDNNNHPRFFEVSVYPLVDEKNQINEFVHISRDVTERQQKAEELKRAYVELHKVQTELMDSEKLAAVGVLASGVAHEIRNPLAVILQGVNFLEGKLKPCPRNISDTLNMIKDNVKRSDNIIDGIFSFSRKTELSKQNESIESILESSLVLVEHKIKLGNIEISRQFQADLPKIFVDRQKIEQALVNILLNAIEAMPGGGKIFIRVYSKKLDEIKNGVGKRKSDMFALGEEALIVEIEDTGTGISKENTDKLFLPFFTTKGPNKGLGLGLSVTRNIMLMHRGVIDIVSQEGKFTKAVLSFKIGEERTT